MAKKNMESKNPNKCKRCDSKLGNYTTNKIKDPEKYDGLCATCFKEDVLDEKCNILQEVIILLHPIYKPLKNNKQKDFLETMIGAAIFYLPTPQELYNGHISLKGLDYLKEGGLPPSKLTKEHIYPRKKTGRILLGTSPEEFEVNGKSLKDLFLDRFGKYNLVRPKENTALKKVQKDGSNESWKEDYKTAKIEHIALSIAEIKNRVAQ